MSLLIKNWKPPRLDKWEVEHWGLHYADPVPQQKDMLGIDIGVTDIIAYAITSGRSASLGVGKIIGISCKRKPNPGYGNKKYYNHEEEWDDTVRLHLYSMTNYLYNNNDSDESRRWSEINLRKVSIEPVRVLKIHPEYFNDHIVKYLVNEEPFVNPFQ